MWVWSVSLQLIRLVYMAMSTSWLRCICFSKCGPTSAASHHREFVRNAESQALLQTYWIRMCVLSRSFHNSDAHWHLTTSHPNFRTSLWGSNTWKCLIKLPVVCACICVKCNGSPRYPRLYLLVFPPLSHMCTTHILRSKSIRNVFPIKTSPLSPHQHTHTQLVTNF